MTISKKSKFSAITLILYIITGLYIGFIWIHSSMSAEISASESKSVLDFLASFLKSFGITAELTDHIVRKAAHFCEFALLGFLTFWCAWRLDKLFLKNLMPVGFVCLAAAVIDEFIQNFSDGRSAEVNDVILDFSGSVVGVFAITVILLIKIAIRKGRR